MSTESRRLVFAPNLVRKISAPRARSMAQTAGLVAIAVMVMWLAA